MAAPVYGAAGSIVAAMSIAVPSVRFTPTRRDDLLALVQSQARRLSTILGFPRRLNLE